MVIGAPPLQLSQQGWGLLRRCPGAACERCHPVTDGQIHPFDKSGIQPSREAQPLQASLESVLSPEPHHVRDPHQLAPAVAFLHLAVDQTWLHQPSAHVASSTTHLSPLAKVGRERIKVQIEPITGKERQTARSQELSQRVNDPMGHVLGAGTELKHGQNLGARIDG